MQVTSFFEALFCRWLGIESCVIKGVKSTVILSLMERNMSAIDVCALLWDDLELMIFS